MFTGLIEKSGVVVANLNSGAASRLIIRASFDQLKAGESIAINGVCLTLLPDFDDQLVFDLSPETLKITTLSELSAGDYVNIERAMLATTRFGGHYVSGHVDTKAHLQSIIAIDDYIEMTVGDFAKPSDRYLLPKGSISLDGVSLTINEVSNGRIKVMLVPHTLSVTTLGRLKVGQCVNVEFDYLTRIIAQQVSTILAN